MSNVTKIALSAAIVLSTAFSALAASKPGATREQAASSGTGVASYDRNVSSRVTGASDFRR
jgi:hypothetical protein